MVSWYRVDDRQWILAMPPNGPTATSSLPMFVLVVAYAVSAFPLVHSSMTFPLVPPESPLAGVDLYAASTTTFIGPQPGDPNSTRTGPLVVVTSDMCEPTTMLLPGAIVLASTEAQGGACDLETQYLMLYGTGAAALIFPAVDDVPSLTAYYSNDGSRGALTRHLPMLFLRIGPSSDLYNVLLTDAPGKNATVFPDVNVWQATLTSWYYQLFVRILPSSVLIASGVTAAVYFASHMGIVYTEYQSAVTEGCRSLPRLIGFLRKSLSPSHAVLAVEMTTASLTGVILAVDGFYSTANLPFPVVGYFVTMLSGWSFASSLLSASVWVRHLSRLVASNSLLTRIVRGDFRIVFILLIVVPIAIDTAVSALLTMHYNTQGVTTVVSAIIFLLQLTVGLHVLLGVLRYYWTVRDIQSHVNKPAGRGSRLVTILRRLSHCALGMSLSMLMLCMGTVLMAASSAFMYTPAGWTICFTLSYTGRALDSAFRVAMFKPRSNTSSSSRTTSGAAVIIPKPKKPWTVPFSGDPILSNSRGMHHGILSPDPIVPGGWQIPGQAIATTTTTTTTAGETPVS